MPPTTTLRGDIFATKITKSHLTKTAAAILTIFTIINFHAISMTTCCDPANNLSLHCAKSPLALQGLASSKRKLGQPIQEIAPPESLESSLLYLFDTIQPPHWSATEFGEQHLNMKSVVNAYHRLQYVDKEDITLVTHGSIENFSELLDQVSKWQGPVSFVMYLNNIADIQRFCLYMKTKATQDFLEYVSVHVLLEKHEGTLPYPNNVLRNLAQRSIESNYFLLMEVDFIPSPGTYEYLKSSLKNDYFWSRLRNNTVFVLPTFERLRKDDDSSTAALDTVPTTKDQLRALVANEKAVALHDFFPPGKDPNANYIKWLASHDNLTFSYPIEYSKRFEPHVVAYKRGIPDFWDGFRGYGFNTATWFWELYLAGYTFETIGGGYYLFHLNNRRTVSKERPTTTISDLQIRRFMRYISGKYQADQINLRDWESG